MQKSLGFTLIEVMITLAVATIIMVIAIPAGKTMQANARISSVANELAIDLKKTRASAITSRRNYTFLAINPSVSANPWGNSGWRVTQQLGSTTNTEFENKNTPSSVTVKATLTSIVFSAATGMVLDTTTGNAITNTLVFAVCDTKVNNETGYDVMINRFGQVQLIRHTGSNAAKCSSV